MINQVVPTEMNAEINTLSSSPVGKIIVVDDEPEARKAREYASRDQANQISHRAGRLRQGLFCQRGWEMVQLIGKDGMNRQRAL